MTNEELKKMGRAELLEILLAQAERIEQLEQELSDTRRRLKTRQIKEAEAGNIAEAALRVGKVFEAAQQAADVYVENVRREADAHLDNVRQEADAYLKDVMRKADAYLENVRRKADEEYLR